MRTSWAGVALTFALLAPIGSNAPRATVGGTTLHVPAEFPTIQSAIEAAVGGDTVLVAPGLYQERISFLGKAILVSSSDGPEVTVIHSQGQPPFVHAATEREYFCTVLFADGEDLSSMLRGFSVTGGGENLYSTCDRSGGIIAAFGAAPHIIDCVITGNAACWGGGYKSDLDGPGGLLSGCVITGNWAVDNGGGVYGAADIEDCEISLNWVDYYSGGGVYATDVIEIKNSRIVENHSWGRHGGGVAGPAMITGSLIANNTLYAGELICGLERGGAGLWMPLSVDRCTVVGNEETVTCLGYIDTYLANGIVMDDGVVVSSIVRGNLGGSTEQIAPYDDQSVLTVDHSNVQGGYPGVGNLDAVPGFFDPTKGDYDLLWGSASIDSGDPNAPLDPDGSIADQGAFPYVSRLKGKPAELSFLGGIQNLTVGADQNHTGDLYVVLGTHTGTTPGFPLAPGFHMPINPDAWTSLSIVGANGTVFENTVGIAGGDQVARIHVPAVTPLLIGVELHHAVFFVDPATLAPTFVSEPVSLTIVSL